MPVTGIVATVAMIITLMVPVAVIVSTIGGRHA
jgi:hypothetical protein